LIGLFIPEPMNPLTRKFRPLVFGASLLMLFAYLLLPELFGQAEIAIFIFCMVVTGIPHGATDHLIYQYHQPGQRTAYGRFFMVYLGTMALYSLLWYYLPLLSLLLFILISAYHFGQSQFLYLPLAERHPLKTLLYLAWGLFILLALIFFNPQASQEVLRHLLPAYTFSNALLHPLYTWGLGSLYGGIMLLFGYLLARRIMKPRQFLWEVLNQMLLLSLFHYTSLWISFAVYFGLWHAIGSILAEVEIFRAEGRRFDLWTFAKAALPLSLASFAGIGLLLLAGTYLGSYFSVYLLFFIAISTLTVPHMYYMQAFYAKGLPRDS
jgi:beta-carotene 15,15'-dioxygenase